MPVLERTERLPLTVDRKVLHSIVLADNPDDALKILLKHEVDVAVSILDNLDPLTAAFLVFRMQTKHYGGGSIMSQDKRRLSGKILERGRELQIRGMNGLCYARDQVYRNMGYEPLPLPIPEREEPYEPSGPDMARLQRNR